MRDLCWLITLMQSLYYTLFSRSSQAHKFIADANSWKTACNSYIGRKGRILYGDHLPEILWTWIGGDLQYWAADSISSERFWVFHPPHTRRLWLQVSFPAFYHVCLSPKPANLYYFRAVVTDRTVVFSSGGSSCFKSIYLTKRYTSREICAWNFEL